MSSNELVKTNSENSLTEITPFDKLPDYLKGKTSDNDGLGALDQGDYKIPRVKILQSNNPEILKYPGVALPGHFWHTGANINLGKTLKMVVAVAHKRVILYSSRNNNAQMLAFSVDGKTWASGSNQEFIITPKKGPPHKVHTKANVLQSGLLNWGTSEPNDPKSAPAATQIYEYLIHLVDHPGISPCMFGMYRTMANNAKSLNTQLLMVKQQGRPITSVAVEVGAEMQTHEGNTWFIPNFKLAGIVSEACYNRVKAMQESYQSVTANIPPEDDIKQENSGTTTKPNISDDEIPF